MTTHKVDLAATTVAATANVSPHVKHDFSKQHLRAAVFFATQAREAEALKDVDEPQRAAHRAHVTAAVLSAVAFLESSINELYLSAIHQDLTALPNFDARLFQLVTEFWEHVERHPILHKYRVALLLADKAGFDRGTAPYQEAESLVKLRDCLVHYKPEWDDESGHHQKLADRLKGRFALNPYAAEGNLWFPHQCLGAGCAEWSVEAARSLSDDFCNRLGIPRRTV